MRAPLLREGFPPVHRALCVHDDRGYVVCDGVEFLHWHEARILCEDALVPPGALGLHAFLVDHVEVGKVLHQYQLGGVRVVVAFWQFHLGHLLRGDQRRHPVDLAQHIQAGLQLGIASASSRT